MAILWRYDQITTDIDAAIQKMSLNDDSVTDIMVHVMMNSKTMGSFEDYFGSMNSDFMVYTHLHTHTHM